MEILTVFHMQSQCWSRWWWTNNDNQPTNRPDHSSPWDERRIDRRNDDWLHGLGHDSFTLQNPQRSPYKIVEQKRSLCKCCWWTHPPKKLKGMCKTIIRNVCTTFVAAHHQIRPTSAATTHKLTVIVTYLLTRSPSTHPARQGDW